jgi:FAD/FMN-containing dehydrogenase
LTDIRHDTPEKTLDDAIVKDFAERFRGEVILPDSPSYDEARKVFNGMIDRKPALIARCAGVADVMAAVVFARANELTVAVRGGGHSVPGYGTCDGGIVIDVSPMKGMWVNPEKQTVRAQAGLTWGEFDRETQAFGLAVTGGRMSGTGIAGLTLGGGSGWIERKCGFGADNLISVEIVTAEGKFIKASESENPELFWGVRGGGGNFGVATSFEFRLHPVGPIVLGGMFLYPIEQAREVARFYRDLMEDAPDGLGGGLVFLTAPPEPFIPEEVQGTKLVAIFVCFVGPVEEGEAAIRPIREAIPPAMDMVEPMPYTVLQTLLDAGNPSGMRHYWKAGFLDELPDEAIDTAIEHAKGMTSPMTVVALIPMGGAVARVGGDALLGLRNAAYNYHILTQWPNPADDPETHIAWTRGMDEALKPWTNERVYLNFIGDEGEERVKSGYGPEKYVRLAALKAEYDPENLFRLNQNIKPSG